MSDKARGDFWQFVFFSMAAMVRLGYLSLDVYAADELSERHVLTLVIQGGIESGALMSGDIPWPVVVDEARIWGVDANALLDHSRQLMDESLMNNRKALGL